MHALTRTEEAEIDLRYFRNCFSALSTNRHIRGRIHNFVIRAIRWCVTDNEYKSSFLRFNRGFDP